MALPEAAARRIVFGGSFCPPHIGHQLVCLYLLEGLGFDEVILVPTASHAFGKRLPAMAQRCAWLAALCGPLGPRVRIDDIEERLGGISRTYTTLVALEQETPLGTKAPEPLSFAIGSDLVAEVPRWFQAEALCRRFRAVVLPRAGHPTDADAVRRALGEHALLAPVGLPEVSSTQVRQRLAQSASLAGLMPKGVIGLLGEQPFPW